MKTPTAILVASVLSALAEPIRLRILRLLEAGELTVGEVARVVQLPQSTVSRHLKALHDAAWVARRAEGPAAFFRVVLDDLPEGSRAVWLAVRGQISAGEVAEDDRRLRAVLAERRVDSQAFFGRVAGEWDSLRNSLYGPAFTAPALLSLLSREWTVADLGCGTGNAAELLAPRVKRVIAVDFSAPMIDAAKERLGGAGNIDFVRGDLTRLPIAGASVDAAVCILVLHHLDDPVAAVGEMRRVLRAGGGGGVALVVDMLPHDREPYRATMGHKHLGFSQARIGSMFREAGFAEVSWTPLPPDPDARGPGLFAAAGRIEG